MMSDQSIRNLFRSLPAGRVLDVATGSGGFVHFLIENLPGYDEIIAIDNNERGAAAFAEAFKDHPNVRFMVMDAQAMDFPDASFDVVCIANSLHHLAEQESVLAEMKRLLKPGGHLVICEMYRDDQNETQLTHVYLHHWWAAVDTAQGVTHGETFTRQQILETARGLDLRSLVWFDYCDPSQDPNDPETVRYLDGIIDRYIQRLDGLPQQAPLAERGEELRQRVQTVGFQSATSLIVIGQN